jgi:hypothetical protein
MGSNGDDNTAGGSYGGPRATTAGIYTDKTVAPNGGSRRYQYAREERRLNRQKRVDVAAFLALRWRGP